MEQSKLELKLKDLKTLVNTFDFDTKPDPENEAVLWGRGQITLGDKRQYYIPVLLKHAIPAAIADVFFDNAGASIPKLVTITAEEQHQFITIINELTVISDAINKRKTETKEEAQVLINLALSNDKSLITEIKKAQADTLSRVLALVKSPKLQGLGLDKIAQHIVFYCPFEVVIELLLKRDTGE